MSSGRGRQWKPWLFLLVPLYLLSYSTVTAPGGYTGGFEQKGRDCSACHQSAVDNSKFLLRHNIPSEGYTPDSVYFMSVEIDSVSAPLYGFSCSSELPNRGHTGWFTADSTTQLTGSYIGHLGGDDSPGRRNGEWTFQWQAPSKGTGQVTFFTAVVAANESDNTLGDQVYLHKVEVEEVVSTGLPVESVEKPFSMERDRVVLTKAGVLEVYNSSGQLLLRENNSNQADRVIDLSDFKGQLLMIVFDRSIERYYIW